MSEGTPEDTEDGTKLRCRHRGPLVVSGRFELRGTDGELIDLEGRTKILLCRCGATKNAPFCDSSHYKTDFEAS